MNSSMKNILSDNDKYNCNAVIERLDSFVRDTKILNGCIIYDRENLKSKDIDMNKLLKFTKNFTEYEIGCNELLLDKKDSTSYREIAIYFLKLLENKFYHCKFVVYLIVKNDVLEIRFHKYRKEDGLWLSRDLEVYEEPTLCVTSLNVNL